MVDGIIDSMDMNLGKLWKIVRDWEVWQAAVHGVSHRSMYIWKNRNTVDFL